MGQQGPLMLNRAPHTLLWKNVWGAHPHFANYVKLHKRLARHALQRIFPVKTHERPAYLIKVPLGISPRTTQHLKLFLSKVYHDTTQFTNLVWSGNPLLVISKIKQAKHAKTDQPDLLNNQICDAPSTSNRQRPTWRNYYWFLPMSWTSCSFFTRAKILYNYTPSRHTSCTLPRSTYIYK